MTVFDDLDKNIAYIEEVLVDCGDIVKRKIPIGTNLNRHFYMVYFDGMIMRQLLDEAILPRMMATAIKAPENFFYKPMDMLTSLKDGGITTADLTEEKDLEKIVQEVLGGNTAIFVDGADAAIVVATKGFPNRGVPQTSTEVVVLGANEAFSEVFRFNTALLRRRIKDAAFKIQQIRVGRRSLTDVALCYLDDVVRKPVLDEVKARIEKINIDGVLDSGALEEFIEDDCSSPFPQCQVTERPDKAASAILEGRVAIIVDNSPGVLLVPAVVDSFFQSSEDYSQGWDIMSFTRLLRFAAAFLALALPGLYIAITIFHPNMLPMMLTFKMAAARASVPLPAVLEVLVLEFAFELLREAGIRLPQPVGASIGIIGGLIVGEAAVIAGIISPIVVIIVALSGIASFAVPSYSLMAALRLAKFIVIALSAALGMLGFWLALLILVVHTASLKSFGLPYLFPFAAGDLDGYTDFKDSLFRLPMMFMKKRPIYANPEQKKRQL